jgi:hypothetical protein
MGPTLHTVSFPELTDLIRKEFVKNQQLIVPAAGELFIKDSIGKGQGNTKRYDEVDTQTYGKRKREGAAASKASVAIGYNVTMTKKRIAMEIDITQEMRDENRYPEVGSLITNLTHFCPQRIELDMTHILTFAGATTYVDMDGDTNVLTVGDGLALVTTSHSLKYSPLTYSNRVSGDPIFSKGALESAETLATTNILSNFGERRVLNFNAIITGDDPNTVNTVKQFLNSVADNTQNNSGVMNVYKGKYKHIILPQLATTATGAYDSTKRQYWFLGAIGMGVNGWQSYYGVWEESHLKHAPTEGKNNDDYSRDIWTYGTRAGYGLRAVTGRGIIGSLVTSS